MKKLLFVQTGDARPKYAGDVNGPLLHWCKHDLSEDPGALVFVPEVGNFKAKWPVHQRMAAADRWLLVECANADAGRALIAAVTMPTWGGSWQRAALDRARSLGLEPHGRILASGGRPA